MALAAARARPPGTAQDPAPARLSLDDLVPYLVDRRLLPARVAVDHPLTLQDVSRRNRVFRVLVPGGRNLLVKQAGNPARDELRSGIAAEAALLRAVARREAFARARRCAPRFVAYDPSRLVLVTELVHPATTLTKYHLNVGDVRFPKEGARTAAWLLADLRIAAARETRRGGLRFLPGEPPPTWALLEGRGELDSPAARAVARDAARRRSLAHRIEEVRAAWPDHDDLVHGDARWDNVLVTQGQGPRGALNARLIDWEMARRGDAAWDVAFGLGEYLRFWLSAMVFDPVQRLEDAFARAPFPLERAHDAARCFLAAYTLRCRLGSGARAGLLERACAHLPAALGVVALEFAQVQAEPPGVARVALEMAERSAEEPATCAEAWLGLRGER